MMDKKWLRMQQEHHKLFEEEKARNKLEQEKNKEGMVMMLFLEIKRVNLVMEEKTKKINEEQRIHNTQTSQLKE